MPGSGAERRISPARPYSHKCRCARALLNLPQPPPWLARWSNAHMTRLVRSVGGRKTRLGQNAACGSGESPRISQVLGFVHRHASPVRQPATSATKKQGRHKSAQALDSRYTSASDLRGLHGAQRDTGCQTCDANLVPQGTQASRRARRPPGKVARRDDTSRPAVNKGRSAWVSKSSGACCPCPATALEQRPRMLLQTLAHLELGLFLLFLWQRNSFQGSCETG